MGHNLRQRGFSRHVFHTLSLSHTRVFSDTAYGLAPVCGSGPSAHTVARPDHTRARTKSHHSAHGVSARARAFVTATWGRRFPCHGQPKFFFQTAVWFPHQCVE